LRVRKKLLATARAVAARWLSAAEDTATSALRTDRGGGHVGRVQVRQPVIMVGATASGPSCKKIGRRNLSPAVKERQDIHMRGSDWLVYVRRRAGATCNHRGGAHGAHSTCSCTSGERARFRRSR